MALAEGVLARWRRWLLYSWGALLLLVPAGLWWGRAVAERRPNFDLDALWIPLVLAAAMLPAGVATFLWELRWGRRRLDADGDAFGATVATACLMPLALAPSMAAPGVVMVGMPLFMALRAHARAHTAAPSSSTSYLRALLLLLSAQAITLAVQPLLQPAAAQILIVVPILLAAVALGLRSGGPRAGLSETVGVHRPTARSAWLVALLPAVTIVFAQALNPAGFTYADTTLALIAATIAGELAFRGFAFLQLRRAGARFLVAAVVPGMISLVPAAVHARHELGILVFAGVLAEAVWLAWLVERWQSVWIAVVSAVLLTIGIDSFVMFAEETRIWFTLALRLWIIGMSVAVTQTLQRRSPTLPAA